MRQILFGLRHPMNGRGRLSLGKTLIGFGVIVLACFSLAPKASALTITSTVLEDNGATSNGLDGDQNVYSSPTAGPGVLTTAGGYDFTATTYMTLTSITSITVTLTMQDGDSASGNFDYNYLRLSLDGTGTGLILNGFRGDGLQDTLTFVGAPTNSATLLASLETDGKLVGTVTTGNPNDTITSPNEIYFGNDAGNQVTSLSITGVPEPGTWACIGFGLLGLVSVQRGRSRR